MRWTWFRASEFPVTTIMTVEHLARAPLRHRLLRKPVNPAAAVLDDVKIVSRVHGYTVTLIELARQITDLVEGRDDLAGLALDDAMRELFRFTTNMNAWA